MKLLTRHGDLPPASGREPAAPEPDDDPPATTAVDLSAVTFVDLYHEAKRRGFMMIPEGGWQSLPDGTDERLAAAERRAAAAESRLTECKEKKTGLANLTAEVFDLRRHADARVERAAQETSRLAQPFIGDEFPRAA
jgi:hypothetical protein